MRILSQLRIISAVAIAAVVVLTPMLFWSLSEFNKAKNDYVLANLILDNFFERASLRDQYFLYREEHVRMEWDENKAESDRLLQQAARQFKHGNSQQVLERLRRNIEDTALIFHRIASNSVALYSASGNRQVYAELDKRLASQLLLKAGLVRDTATLLKENSARQVELTYKYLILIISLFVFTLAFATILTSAHLGRIIRKRLEVLHDGAKIVADGNLNYQIKVDDADEFSELAQSINAMTDKLNEEILSRQLREEQLAEAQDIARIGSWHVLFGEDESRDIWTISKELQQLYGQVDGKEVDFSTGLAVMPPEDKIITQRYWAEAKRGVGSLQWDHRIIVNCKIRWMHVLAKFVFDAGGRALEASGTCQDITERKLTELRLAESESRFHEIFDTINDAIFIHDAKTGCILDVNQRMLDMYGLSREQILTSGADELSAGTPPYTSADVAEKIHLTNSQGPQVFEWLARAGSGRLFWVEVSLRPALIDNEKRILAVVRDITERKQAENALRKNEENLKTIFDTLSEGVALNEMIFDETGEMVDYRIVQVNDAFYRTADFIKGSTVIGEVATCLYGMDVATINGFWKTHRNFGETVTSEFVSSISHRCFSVATSPFINNRFVTSFQDITERKQTEMILQKSEARFRAIIEASPVPYALNDDQQNIIYLNMAFTRTFGYTRDDIPTLEQWWPKAYPDPNYRQQVATNWQDNIEESRVSNKPFEPLEINICCKNGSVRTALVGASSIGPSFEGMHLVTLYDITERKQAEALLLNSEEKLQAVLNSSEIAIAWANETGIIEYVNPKFVSLFGYDLEEVSSIEQWYLHAYPDAAYRAKVVGEWNVKVVRSLTQKTAIEPMEMDITCKDGAVRHVLLMGSWFGNRLLANFSDITERKKQEMELLRSNSELEQFSYAISHDMRQPLRMVSSYLQLIQMNLVEKLDASNREYFRFAIEGAQRLDQMLLGMLDYSRVGRKSAPFVWVESRAVLNEALLFLGPMITETQAALEICGLWPKVLVSRDEIMRLLQNLVGNALKYRVAGRVPLIHISSQMEGGLWRFSVQDNGIGIDPNQIGRLFQVFQRLQSRSNFAGNGIGLALCRKIVEHHDGRIWALSAGEDKGCTFSVELPVQPAITDE